MFFLLSLLFLTPACSDSTQHSGTTGEANAGAKSRTAHTGTAGNTTDGTAKSAPKWTKEPARTSMASSMTRKTSVVYGYTYGQVSGNRIAEGEGRILETKPIEVQLSGTPAWVVGVPLERDTAWVVAYGDGRVETFRLSGEGNQVEPWLTAPDKLPPGAPPAVTVDGDQIELLTAPDGGGSPLTHPVRTEAGLLWVNRAGALRSRPGEVPSLQVLPDARIVQSEDGSVAVLSSPTRRYDHGVIGDAIEAGSINVLKPGGGGYRSSAEIRPESGGVFEGLSPLWFRPAPGEEELLAVTESVTDLGSRISVYDPGGTLVAAGPFIGIPKKWRHLIAAGPFGPEGEIEIVAMRAPHVGGTTEFYRLDREKGSLEIAATGKGYPSHTIYSRNLDAVRAGDFDGDGAWELVAPNASYTRLVATRHTRSGVEPAWTLPLNGALATNLATATGKDGHIALAAGTLDGTLRIWH